jgi:hypothetical protein
MRSLTVRLSLNSRLDDHLWQRRQPPGGTSAVFRDLSIPPLFFSFSERSVLSPGVETGTTTTTSMSI